MKSTQKIIEIDFPNQRINILKTYISSEYELMNCRGSYGRPTLALTIDDKKYEFLYIVVHAHTKKINNIKGTNMSSLTLNYTFYVQNKLSLRFLEHSIISTLWSASSSQLMCYAVPGSAYKSYRQLYTRS